MVKPRVLVVDDDQSIARFIIANLRAKGFDVLLATSGDDALDAVEKNLLDLIILDIGIPGPDGVEVCRRIREWSKVPIIMLSARAEEKDKVRCLELGADDYLTKPFGLAELVARIQTALRHHDAAKALPAESVSTLGDIEVNFARRSVTLCGTPVKLTPTEYCLLQQLAVNKNKVLTHDVLLKKVWGEHYGLEREYLRVFVGRLRQKLEPDPSNPRYIVTVPGVGYCFNVDN